MELLKKKRGRKPKNYYNDLPEKDIDSELQESSLTEKKKRGRKKKYEIENSEKILNRDHLNNFNHSIAYSDDEETIGDKENQIKNISFGNLNITVSKKVQQIEDTYRSDIINKMNETVINEDEYSDEETQIPIENILNLNQEKFEKFYKDKKKYTSSNEVIKEHSMKRFRIVTTLKNVIKEEEWPNETDVCCWWCCHKFNNSPCTLPTKYDSLRKRYTFTGIFCSWNCVRAYNFDKSDHRMGERSGLISMLVRELYSSVESISIKPAPHRQCLKMFGGYMSIEEFRNGSSHVDAFLMNLINSNYIYPEITEVTNVKTKLEKKNLRLSRN